MSSAKNRERKEREARNHLELAKHHYETGDYEMARDCLTKALGRHATAETFLLRAAAYLQIQRNESMELAVADVTEALKLEPTNEKAIELKAMLYGLNGARVEAENVAERLAPIDPDKMNEVKRSLKQLSVETAPSIPYKNELFDVHFMGQKALDRDRAKSLDLRQKPPTKGPVYFIKKLPSAKSPFPNAMFVLTLADLKEILDNIRVGGGVLWTLALDNILVDEQLMEFFRSLEPIQLTGNIVRILKIHCSAEYFAEMFSGKLLNPRAFWIDGVDNIEGFNLQKAIVDLPALHNIKEFKLNMAISNELFQKSVLQPPYFTDIGAFFDYVERPISEEAVRTHHSLDIFEPHIRSIITHDRRQFTMDWVRLGMPLAEFKKICTNRFMESRSKCAAYHLEISSKKNPTGVVDEEQRKRGGLLLHNEHTQEVMVFQVIGSDAFGADGQPKSWLTIVQRKSKEILYQDMMGEVQKQRRAAGQQPGTSKW